MNILFNIERLFLCSVKPLFKNGLVAQGRFLVKMLTLLLGSLENDTELEETLYRLVISHNARGIKVKKT